MRRWRNLHTWFGVGAGLFIFMTAGTGALLMLGELDHADDPELPAALRTAPASADAVIRAAEAGRDLKVRSLKVSHGPDQMWKVEMDNGDAVFLSPGGQIVEWRPLPVYTPVLALAISLHTGGIAGMAGHAFMLLVSLVLGGSVVTGVLIWPWLRRRMKARAQT